MVALAIAWTGASCAAPADRYEHFENFEELEARDALVDVRDSGGVWSGGYLDSPPAEPSPDPGVQGDVGDTGEVAAAGADAPLADRTSTGTEPLHTERVGTAGDSVADREQRIRALFGVGSPLAPYADLFVGLSDSLGIDWRLAPAIAVWESSAGRHACGGNAYGIGSCAIEYRYETWEAGVEAVTALLASPMYQGLTTAGILCRWVAGTGCTSEHAIAYSERVQASMESLGER